MAKNKRKKLLRAVNANTLDKRTKESRQINQMAQELQDDPKKAEEAIFARNAAVSTLIREMILGELMASGKPMSHPDNSPLLKDLWKTQTAQRVAIIELRRLRGEKDTGAGLDIEFED